MEQNKEFRLAEPSAPVRKTGPVLGLIAFLVLVAAAVVFFTYHRYSRQTAQKQAAVMRQGLYTPELIQEFMSRTARQETEFDILKVMDMDISGDTIGVRESRKPMSRPQQDILNVYREVLAYNPQNPAIQDGMEKLHYLSIRRAETYSRKGRYKEAVKYYRRAKNIKPLAPQVRGEMERAEQRLAAMRKGGELPQRRSAEEAYQDIQTKLNFVRYLFEQERKISPTLQGKITVGFTIRPDGSVSEAHIEYSTLNDPHFENILLGHVKLWDFGAVDARAGDLKLNYPFIFVQ